jgi:phosphoribosylformimino-5-aminoimidazole carboxamide ribotide isomerase
MEIIPAIDLRGGRCVRLLQGDYSRETVFSDDPVSVACRWEELGAPRLHIVDLEGAKTGTPSEVETIERIASAVSIPIQIGGGLRTLEQANRYLRAGAERIVFGTAAVKDRRLISEAIAMDPSAVVVALDARNGRIQTDGWIEGSDIGVLDLAQAMQDLGVPRVLATDIVRDGMLTEPNYAGLAELRASTTMQVIASGGVSAVVQLSRLAELGMEGAIIGRALYTGAIDLGEALEALCR